MRRMTETQLKLVFSQRYEEGSMKKIFTGWVGNFAINKLVWDSYAYRGVGKTLSFPEVTQKKGNLTNRCDNDWPPIKVKITIEVMK